MRQSSLRYISIVLFLILLLSLFFFGAPQAQTNRSMVLQTSGTNIFDLFGNTVYLRGIGRSGDLHSASGMWSGPNEPVFNWEQKWASIDSNIPKMEATFQCYRDQWHVNMIRILIPVDWWWIDIVYPQENQPNAPNNNPISYRNYIETVVQKAAKYGLYVDFCPYSVVNSYFYSGESEGEPGTWVPQTSSYEFIQNVTVKVNKSESQFWRDWWTSVSCRLGKYANVIFEMWNEPGWDKEVYFNYMIEGYRTIRSLHYQNLVFMQWQPGIVPKQNTLTWAPELYGKLQMSIGQLPVNVVFTTHPYLDSPYPNLQWAYDYSEVKKQLLDSEMVPQTRSSNCNVPLVFNEMGVLNSDLTFTQWSWVYHNYQEDVSLDERRHREYSFWDAILHNAKDLGIGVCAYYWMHDSVARDYGYKGESLVASNVWSGVSPTPNFAGQAFINYSLSGRFAASSWFVLTQLKP